MGRSNRFMWGVSTDAAGSIVIAAAGLLTTPLILRMTSPGLYGFWLGVLAVLGFVSLSDFGMSDALIRQVATRFRSETTNQQCALVSTAFFFYGATGSVVCAAGMAVATRIPAWLHVPEADAATAILAFRLALAAAAISFPLSTFSHVLSGTERLALKNGIRDMVALITVLLSVVFVQAGMSIAGLALATLIAVVIGGAASVAGVRSAIPELVIRPSLVNRGDLRELTSLGTFFQIGGLANAVSTGAASLIIGRALGASWVTPYAITAKLAITASVTIPSKIVGALFPGITTLYAQGDAEPLRRVFLRLTWALVRLSVMSATFVALNNRAFVTLWVGPAYYAGSTLTLALLLWVLQDTIGRGMTVVIQASGDLKPWALVSLLEATLNIFASIALVGRLGLTGVALGMTIGKTLTSSLYLPHLICRRLGQSRRQFLWRAITVPILWSTPGVLATWGIAHSIPDTWGWFKIGVVGVAVVASNAVMFEGRVLARHPRARLRDLVIGTDRY